MPTSATGTLATSRIARGGGGPRGSGRRLRRGHGSRRLPARVAGFTLVEILVVVVIIAIVAAGMMLSVNLTGRDRDLQREGDRLFALINYTREQAELQTREYGLQFTDDGYQFLVFDPLRGIWRDVTEDDALDPRKLPDGLDVKLRVEARDIVLTHPDNSKDKTSLDDKPRDRTPQVMIFSDGDLTSFAARLERDNGLRSLTVTQDDTGAVVEQPMVEAGQP
jgi:general secretion pathway protein H